MLSFFGWGEDFVDPNLRLTTNYTVADLSRTDTGIDNKVPEDYLPNLQGLADALEILQKNLGRIKVVSAFRSEDVNAAVGGARGSKHQTGEAADFYPLGDTSINYFLKILGNNSLRNMLGEITFKEHQGTIHITLPYGLTKGSARIAEVIGGRTIYRSITSTEEQTLSKEKTIASLKTNTVAKASMPIWIPATIFISGIGATLLALLKRRK